VIEASAGGERSWQFWRFHGSNDWKSLGQKWELVGLEAWWISTKNQFGGLDWRDWVISGNETLLGGSVYARKWRTVWKRNWWVCKKSFPLHSTLMNSNSLHVSKQWQIYSAHLLDLAFVSSCYLTNSLPW
jgi:hypothetical protein